MKIIDAQVHIWSQTTVAPNGGHPAGVELQCRGAAGGNGARPASMPAWSIPPASWDARPRFLARDRSGEEVPRPLRREWSVPARRSQQTKADPRLAPAARHGRAALDDVLLRPSGQQCRSAYDWIWPAAEKAGVPVSLQAGLFLIKFRWIAETYPRLPLIIDHCGLKVRQPKGADALEHHRRAARARRSSPTSRSRRPPRRPPRRRTIRSPRASATRCGASSDAYGPDRFFLGHRHHPHTTCTYRASASLHFDASYRGSRAQDLEKVTWAAARRSGSAGTSSFQRGRHP